MKTIKFIACKYLDYGDHFSAEKNLISLGKETKVVWDRKLEQSLVQFCKRRGRINYPDRCLCKEKLNVLIMKILNIRLI